MNYRELIELMKSDKLESCYYFYGEETYILEKAVKEVSSKFVDKNTESINLSILDGRRDDFDDLKAACETLPFLAPKRVVVLTEVDQLLEKDSEKQLTKYIKELGNHVILIIADTRNTVKKNTTFYKELNKSNRTVQFEKLKGAQLNSWIEKKINSLGKVISNADISYFVQHCGYISGNLNHTLYDVENELLKLVGFTNEETITRKDIEKVLIKPLDKSVFDLLSAISVCNSGKAIEHFNEIYLMEEPIPRILYMITRQFRLILGFTIYKAKGYGHNEIREKLGIKPYEFNKIAQQASGFNRQNLERIIELILETDVALKSQPTDPKVAMELLIVKLCAKK